MGSYVEAIRSRVGAQCVFVPGVRAIILNDRGEVLLQRRADLGRWALPSGSVELDETALAALRREVLEETGLHVHRAEPMGLYSGPDQRFVYPNGDEVQSFAVAFLVRAWSGTPAADGVEGTEVRFWPLTALPADLIEMHERTLRDLGRYTGEFLLAGDHSPREGSSG
jgi:ADP-ribose pyrophosphatase YjhB (NUDIX family)